VSTLWFPSTLPVLSHRVFAQAVRRGALFRVTITREQIEAFQCTWFNQLWWDAWRNMPFYAEWKRSHGLPDEAGALRELNTWPILEKKDLLAGAAGLVRPGPTAGSVQQRSRRWYAFCGGESPVFPSLGVGCPR
jgi:hypothetical protein